MAKTAPNSPDININLLPTEGPSGTTGSAIHWVLTIGRYLIIITEVIALATFLLGIYLSKQKNDLKDSIKSGQKTIDSFQTCDPNDQGAFCEDRFISVQNQINSVASIKAAHFETNKVITEFLSLLPSQMKLDALSIVGNDITFSGKLLTEQDLQTLITTFNNSKRITALDITELSKDTTRDPYLKVSATALINKSGFTSIAN